MTVAILDTATEDEKEKHVSDQVQPAAVQKHGGEDRNHQPGGSELSEPVRGVASGDDSEKKNQAVEIPSGRKLENKRHDVGRDQSTGG